MRFSVLDLALINRHETAAESFAGSVRLARAAEERGYERVWYAEHHGMRSIASSATSVLIAHVASATSTIRVGAGGIMLPNHSPLVIAEQFGTLGTLYPDRIDLGLGRAPGGDQRIFRALRRDPRASDRFPDDVRELQAYLAGDSIVEGVQSYPHTPVPLYILGSSTYGAQVAAAFGLPYSFASHFAPDALEAALAIYRERFQPSEQLERPYAIVAANAIVAPTTEEAAEIQHDVLRSRVRHFIPGVARADDAQIDEILASPHAAPVLRMASKTAAGTGEEARAWLDDFAAQTGADELIVAFQGRTTDERVRSLELLPTD